MTSTEHDEEGGFPKSLPASDRERWDAMTMSQRVRARRRLDAIKAWRLNKISLSTALGDAGLSRTRFYAVAAAFKAAPRLDSLGAFAGVGATRPKLDPVVVNALQAVVADVVAMNDGASVNELVRLMIEAAGVGSNLPGATRLRGIVETEIRRAEATGQAGFALKLDFTAINLPRKDGRPHVMFILIDEGTRLILGASVGDATDEERGYRDAALDALDRISGPLASIRWTDRFMRIDATVGPDRGKAAAFRQRLMGNRGHPPVNLAPARFGKYIRKLVGERIGRIAITPMRTEVGMAVPDNGDMTPWTDEAAAAAMKLAIDQHNTKIIPGLDLSSGRPVMPEDLGNALGILSRWMDAE